MHYQSILIILIYSAVIAAPLFWILKNRKSPLKGLLWSNVYLVAFGLINFLFGLIAYETLPGDVFMASFLVFFIHVFVTIGFFSISVLIGLVNYLTNRTPEQKKTQPSEDN